MKGWTFLSNSRKAHYFDFTGENPSGLSLCSAWMLMSGNSAYLHDDNHHSVDNCKRCARKRDKKYGS